MSFFKKYLKRALKNKEFKKIWNETEEDYIKLKVEVGSLLKEGEDVAEESTEEVSKDNETFEDGNLLTLNTDALNYYKKNVKGNVNTTEDQARRKMTRNMMLAHAYQQDGSAKKHPRTWYSYGCLRFIVKNGEVTWMKNNNRLIYQWKKDIEKYNELNKLLEIEED